MGHTFATGTALRSLRDTSGIVHGNTTIPFASGGAAPGYDANNQYDISNYFTEGTPAVEAVEADTRAATQKEMMAKLGNTITVSEAIEGAAAVAGGYFETFGKQPTVSTGLRNMTPPPEEGAAASGGENNGS